jgi:hypothetical protein
MDELSDQERDYLTKLLSRRHDELLHEVHHAVTGEYKAGLRSEIDLTERLRAKIRPAG